MSKYNRRMSLRGGTWGKHSQGKISTYRGLILWTTMMLIPTTSIRPQHTTQFLLRGCAPRICSDLERETVNPTALSYDVVDYR